MRGLTRLPEPQILINKKIQWRNAFIASGNKRPDSSKYAHSSIKADLISMSFHKCFYCESKLKGEPKEVDHHIEVSVNKSLAFEWTNLYLSCDNCNNKISHKTIPITNALDPCIHNDSVIENHLTFKKELIIPNNNSALGLETIKKYRLDTDLLDTRRLKQLNMFYEAFVDIQLQQIKESRNYLISAEINLIDSFKRLDSPYSLMFKVLLAAYGL